MKHKVIVAHPAKQHSLRTAVAVKENDSLYKYCTTVYYKKGTFVYFLNNFLFSGDTKKKAKSRKIIGLDDNEVMTVCEFFGLVTLLLARVASVYPHLNTLQYKWDAFASSLFYKRIMRYAEKENVDAIIVYDGIDSKHLNILRNTKIKIIMDVSIAHKNTLRKDFEESEKGENLEKFKKEHFYYWDKKLMQKYNKNFLKNNYYIVASEYVRKSLEREGISKTRILKVPYGVDASTFKLSSSKKKSKIMKILYVGGVLPRKGIRRLIETIENIGNENIELYLAGFYSKKSYLYIENADKKYIKFLGFVTRDKLNDLYNQCDMFIFPTLGEGFGMVVLEAMASGIPVLCSSRAGGNDVVEDGKNGYVFNPLDQEELISKMNTLIDDKELRDDFIVRGRKTAEIYTWDKYNIEIGNVLEYVLNDRDL